ASRNLLLSRRAHVDTKPQLEIFADDVKCAHGATVGQLEAEELFYLRSRGLSEPVARGLLTYGFAAEIVDRIPVYEKTIDHIVGILYAKDLLPFLRAAAEEPPALRTLLRPPLFVPESMSVDDLLHELQRRKVHLAIVLDEYGGTAGLVSIEDLLEEIVGEIQDEYDVEEPMVVRLSPDQARLDGRADVDELRNLFDFELPLEDEDEYDTIGGLVYHRVGSVPSPGDQVELDGLTLTVETTDGRRVGKVLAVRRPPEDRDSEDEG
ncbi:MAG: SufD family Fe-S cluster assembly protein, partial [Chloroflexi bacterium]|nr:SufD family Fe-S cluster assembly protein [Chloroflexota bacterium]